MKAEYVKPNVNFEMFSANQAVSSCAPTSSAGISVSFDCLLGEDNDVENVLSTSLFPNAAQCTNQIGFVDYGLANQSIKAGATSSTSDDINQIWVNGSDSNGNTTIKENHSHDNGDIEFTTTTTGSGWNQATDTTGVQLSGQANSSMFLGWAYLSMFEGENGAADTYNTSGWQIGETKDESGNVVTRFLQFIDGISGKGVHAMLAPVFAPLNLMITSY